MDTQANQESPLADLQQALVIINELALKAAGGNYIFRGETECNVKVSSSLYREYERIFPGIVQGRSIETIQRSHLEEAKSFTFENDEWELLTQIQHYGGNTNLIDFTSDYLIALFFACDGKHSVPGRVILLDRWGETGEYIKEPSHPANRIIAQKSVFVRPPTGTITVTPDCVVTIPANLKLPLLDYLYNAHGIAAETIYNDLHGYIRYHAMHGEAFVNLTQGTIHDRNGNYRDAIERYTDAISYNPRLVIAYVRRGIAYRNDGDYGNAITDYNTAIRLNPGLTLAYHGRGLTRAKTGNYQGSVADFTAAIDIDPDLGPAYSDRGEAWLHLSEWDNARADLTDAKDMGVDIVASFHNDYESVDDFERSTGITLPYDIAEMLGG